MCCESNGTGALLYITESLFTLLSSPLLLSSLSFSFSPFVLVPFFPLNVHFLLFNFSKH